jgi:hypothetical protein
VLLWGLDELRLQHAVAELFVGRQKVDRPAGRRVGALARVTSLLWRAARAEGRAAGFLADLDVAPQRVGTRRCGVHRQHS